MPITRIQELVDALLKQQIVIYQFVNMRLRNTVTQFQDYLEQVIMQLLDALSFTIRKES